MNLEFIRDDFKFSARVSALIYNDNQSKILLFNVKGRSYYALPGGKILELEESLNAIKREIKEELGWDNLEFSFFALSEEFVNDKGYNNHQLNIIYKAIYNNPINEIRFKGLEGEWINFEWVDIDKIEQYNIFPKGIKAVILNKNPSNHFVDNLIAKSNLNE